MFIIYVDVDIGIWVSDVKTTSRLHATEHTHLGKYNGPEDHILLSSSCLLEHTTAASASG